MICLAGEAKAGGLGRHPSLVKAEDYSLFWHWRFFHSIIIMIGISLVKISIAFFLRRFVQGKNYQRFLMGFIIFMVAFTISCAGTLIFNCQTHVNANWDFPLQAAPGVHCFSKDTFTNIGIFNSSINIATDVLLALLPIPVVWKLQANMRTKLTLCFVLSLGLFACISSIIKTVKQATAFDDPDFTFHDSFFMWNNIEFCIGILAATLPALRPIFAKVLGATSRFTSNHSKNPRQYNYDQDGLAYGKSKTDKRSKPPSQYYQFDSRQSTELGDLSKGASKKMGGFTSTVTAGDDNSDKGILDQDFHAISTDRQWSQTLPIQGAITKTTTVRVSEYE